MRQVIYERFYIRYVYMPQVHVHAHTCMIYTRILRRVVHLIAIRSRCQQLFKERYRWIKQNNIYSSVKRKTTGKIKLTG